MIRIFVAVAVFAHIGEAVQAGPGDKFDKSEDIRRSDKFARDSGKLGKLKVDDRVTGHGSPPQTSVRVEQSAHRIQLTAFGLLRQLVKGLRTDDSRLGGNLEAVVKRLESMERAGSDALDRGDLPQLDNVLVPKAVEIANQMRRGIERSCGDASDGRLKITECAFEVDRVDRIINLLGMTQDRISRRPNF